MVKFTSSDLKCPRPLYMYLLTTNVYEGVYFNDFIKFRMISDVKKGIIINGLTGSSWNLKDFIVYQLALIQLMIKEF